MRRVRNWRSIRVRNYVLPLLLGALALRFLIPAGFMPEAGDGATVSVAMCSTGNKNELIEIPGEPAKPHCDHCLLPSPDAPRAPFSIAGLVTVPPRLRSPPYESQIPEAPL